MTSDLFIVSDVHGAYAPLASIVRRGRPVLVLGDLVNLIDYRTNVGLLADVVGRDVVAEMVRLRGADPDAARRRWRQAEDELGLDLRQALAAHMLDSYVEMRDQLTIDDADVEMIHGNVDDPDMLRAHLPPGHRWADGTTRTIGGEVFGFAGGGIPRIGGAGEVDDDQMEATLESLGPVEILCTHVPPAIPMLADDVVGGSGKGSRPVLDYLRRHRPRIHYYGDVHQPRAVRLRLDATTCVNVGYFRATHRPWRHRTGDD